MLAYQPVGSLVPDPRNARTHPKRQLEQIAASIREFGFTNPILVDPHRRIIAGHGRLLAAKVLGLAEVPTISLSGLSDGQKRALRLADNKIALGAGWDLEKAHRRGVEDGGEDDDGRGGIHHAADEQQKNVDEQQPRGLALSSLKLCPNACCEPAS